MYIVYDPGEKSKVLAIISNPVPEQESENGFYVDSLPEAETPEGMYPVLMVKIDSKELYYNYVSLPEPAVPENILSDKVSSLELENSLLKAQNAALSERADFIEDCLAEMAMQIYQ